MVGLLTMTEPLPKTREGVLGLLGYSESHPRAQLHAALKWACLAVLQFDSC
jgi:hypothetical protein